MAFVEPRGPGAHARVTPPEEARFEAFVQDLLRRGRAPKTVESYRSDWAGLVDWYASTHEAPFDLMDALDGTLVTAFREHLRAEGMRPATINRKLVFAKRYASWAFGRGDLDDAAHGGVREVNAMPQKPRRPKGLSDIELHRLLREVERRACARDQAIVYTLLETGLRVSELVGLTLEDLCLGARDPCVVVAGEQRPGAPARRVGVGPEARKRLRAWLKLRGDGPGALFTGERGALTANAVQRLVRHYCRFAKVQASPGTLRHTFANSFLAATDGDLVALADVLGHESLETTRLYLSAADDAPGPPEPDAGPRPRPVALKGGRS